MSDVEDLAEIVNDAMWDYDNGSFDNYTVDKASGGIAAAILDRNYVIPKRVVDPGLAGDAD